jgi:hypothetical protein
MTGGGERKIGRRLEVISPADCATSNSLEWGTIPTYELVRVFIKQSPNERVMKQELERGQRRFVIVLVLM